MPHPKHGDDMHDPNICFENPLYALARESRAPQCDCKKAMELHRYEGACDSTYTKFLIVPPWYAQNYFPTCEMCQMGHTSPTRWVCPDKTCQSTIANPKHKQILQICVKCVHTKGIITCGVCKDEAFAGYSLPCSTCETPLCWECHYEWSRMCQKSQMKENPVVPCPFCRSPINALYPSVGSNTRSDNDTLQNDEGEVDLATLQRRDMLLQLAAAFD